MGYTPFYLTHGAAANDLNGGGPRLGTDDGPVYESANVDSAGNGLTLTDNAGSPWSGAAAGDWLTFDIAGSQDRTQITGIEGALAVVSTAVTASLTGKAVRVGGAYGSLDGALSVLTASMRDHTFGHPAKLNIKADSAYTGNATCDHAGSEEFPIYVAGYTSTPGDGGRAELQLALDITGKKYIFLRDLYVNPAAVGSAHAINNVGDECNLYDVWVRSSGLGKHGIYSTSGTNIQVNGCIVVDAGGVGIALDNGGTAMGCKVLSAGSYGIYLRHRGLALGNVVSGASGVGVYCALTGLPIVVGNTIYNCGSHGIARLTYTSGSPALIANNVLVNNAGYGIHQDAEDAIMALHNAFRANTSGEYFNVRSEDRIGGVSLSGDPFVNAAGGDFRIDPRKLAGRELLAAGFPTQLDTTMLNHLDVGALQAKLKVCAHGPLTGGF